MTGRPWTSADSAVLRTRPLRGWTADETSELRRLVAAGLTDGQVGKKLGCGMIGICRKRKTLALKPGQTAAMTVALRRIEARKRAKERRR